MSYRCGACNKQVGPNKHRLTHVIQRRVPITDGKRTFADGRPRTRTEIAREIPVCEDCKATLSKNQRSAASVASIAVSVAAASVIAGVAGTVAARSEAANNIRPSRQGGVHRAEVSL